MNNQEKGEQNKEKGLSLETFRSNLKSTLELIKDGFLPPGTPIGLGELCEARSMDMTFAQVDSADPWVKADKKEREEFLRNVIIALGLVPEQLTSERAERTFSEDGIRGEPSEDGADVLVFKTKYPDLELHLKRYRNELVGNRYDLVVAELNEL